MASLLVVASVRSGDAAAEGVPERLALLDGYRLAFGVAGGLALTALAAALLLGRRPGTPAG
ncbi:hypothetical protein ACWGRK_03950 [Saccharomonospora azurea]|uniref:hypothetical protein n=1 Tax=Saccharomonospora azurea TaxID=40988 RepID=UPI00240A1B95|nr:hypothetical protein [Saccharomonospora azurea]